jgi:hypothetical protein
MPATASQPIHLDTGPAAWNRAVPHEDGVRSEAVVSRTRTVTSSGRARAAGRNEDVDITSPLVSWSTLVDGVALLGVLWSIPLAVLVVGTPIVLTIAFVLWLVRLALTAF